jgi:PAS domain S-box-containing protein
VNTPLRLLHLEDDDADADIVRKTLENGSVICTVTRVETEADFRSSLAQGGFDLILADYTLPEFDGISALNLAREMLPDVPFIFLSGTLDEEVAIDALKIGATDYLFKTRLSRIVPSVQRALREARERVELQRSEAAIRASEKSLRLIVDRIPGLVATMTAAGNVEHVNQRILDYTGRTLEELQDWRPLLHPDDLAMVMSRWSRSVETGQPYEVEHRILRADGVYRWFQVHGLPMLDSEGRVVRWYHLLTDIDERKRAEDLLAGEKRLLEMIARGESRPVILDALCCLVEELAGGSLSSILLLDPNATRLRHGAAPSLPAPYIEAIDGSVIGPSAGSCGTAAYRAEPVIVSDIATDPLWADYRDLALGHGLRACWSTPILSSAGGVLGTFAIYYREPRTPTPHEHNVIERVTHLASIAIERERAEGVLRELAGRLIDAQEEERKRIGRELHDHISQTLGVLTVTIDQLRADRAITPGVAEALEELRRKTGDITDDVRRLSHRLHSSTLDYLGLAPALQKLVSEFSERHDIAITFAQASVPRSLPSEVALCLFRVAEEGLTNIAKHSRARSARVHIAGTEDGLHLTVEDAGEGFDVAGSESKAGLGFVSMQERLRVLHGTIRVDSAPSRGTRLDVWVPQA